MDRGIIMDSANVPISRQTDAITSKKSKSTKNIFFINQRGYTNSDDEQNFQIFLHKYLIQDPLLCTQSCLKSYQPLNA